MKKDMGPRLAVYPIPIYLVATYDSEGKPNVMTVGWGGVCCSSPPCIAVSVRRATHTHQALVERRAFTANLPSAELAGAVSYFGSASGRDENKFERSGLTPVRSDFVDAPYIAETPVNLECKIIQVHELGSHTQFIGQIVNVKMDGDLAADVPLIEQCRPIVYGVGNDHRYYTLGETVLP